MTILIKGMEMPEKCGDCPFFGLQSAGNGMYYDYCNAYRGLVYDADNSVSMYCPLVEVPTPHGRLIDADELKERIAATYYSQEEKDQAPRDDIPWMNGCNTKVKEVCGMIDDAPTVIEAEEE